MSDPVGYVSGGCNDQSNNTDQSRLYCNVTQGSDYYMVIDGWQSDDIGQYGLSVGMQVGVPCRYFNLLHKLDKRTAIVGLYCHNFNYCGGINAASSLVILAVGLCAVACGGEIKEPINTDTGDTAADSVEICDDGEDNDGDGAIDAMTLTVTTLTATL